MSGSDLHGHTERERVLAVLFEDRLHLFQACL